MTRSMFFLCLVHLILCVPVQSNATVLITNQSISGGLCTGSTVQISWDSDLPPSPKQVMLWDGDRGVYKPISDILPMEVHNFQWQVPVDAQPGMRYRIFVRDPQHPNMTDFSDGFLPLRSAAPIVASVQAIDLGKDVVCTPFPADESVQIGWDATRLVTKVEVLNLNYEVLDSRDIEQGLPSIVFSIKHIPNGLGFVRVTGPSGQMAIQPLLIVH